MKLTIAFLISLVGLSCAQYVFPQYGIPQYGNYFHGFQYPQQDAQRDAYYYYVPQGGAVQARVASRDELPAADGRFFGGLISTLGANLLNTKTTSAFVTVTTTTTIGVVQSCIPSNQFKSSNACRRRRRFSELDSDESSRLLSDEPADSELFKRAAENYGLQSSFNEDEELPTLNRGGRTLLRLSAVSTFLGTATSYVFATTTAKQTLFIAAAVSELSCLPAGIAIC